MDQVIDIAFVPIKEHTVLEPFFDIVQTSDDWRDPINTRIRFDGDITQNIIDRTLVQIKHAVRFYTATEAKITQESPTEFRVVAKGYRNGPAGP